jgi:PiT family inorganic phosphate transporter
MISLILLIAICIAFYVAWSIGSNSEVMATTIGTGIFSVRRAVLIAAVFSFIGALTLSKGVMETIGRGIITEEAFLQFPIATVIIGASVGIWLTISTWRRIPVSTTHSILGAILGFGLMTAQKIDWTTVVKIILSIIFSPALALILAVFFHYLLIRKYVERLDGIWERERTEISLGFLQMISAALVAFSFGGNDVAKAIGILLPYFGNSNLFQLQLLGAIGIFLGILTWSSRVLRTVGKEITELIPSSGFIIEISSAISILFFTLIKMPVSVSHTLVGSTIGIGLARGVRKVRIETVKSILFNWFVTIPFTMVLAGILTKILI